MAHFAELDENNVVLRVLVVSNDDITDENDMEQEQLGIGFLKNTFGFNTNWKQTSYSGNFRFRYASIGLVFNETLNAFISPRPYTSWTLNELTADWDPPIPKPSITEEQDGMGYYYYWNEDHYKLDNTTGWVLKHALDDSE